MKVVKHLDNLRARVNIVNELDYIEEFVMAATTETRTLTVTIDAPFDVVTKDLSEAHNHVEWGTEFFDGPARDSDDRAIIVSVPMMGGDVRFRVVLDVAAHLAGSMERELANLKSRLEA